MDSPRLSPALGSSATDRTYSLDFWVFAGVIAVLNLPLLAGLVPEHLVFWPRLVAAGEWWRVLTHPFAHVSWYHLLLDGTAFLLLYAGLEERCGWRRISFVVASGAGSLALSMLTVAAVGAVGLCGLSGIDHGLMAVSGLELARSETRERIARRLGLVSFLVVVVKASIEAATGQPMLPWLHFGLMGVPIAAAHLGGVLGGVAVYWALEWERSRRRLPGGPKG
jgi:rhomboid family GlyGly-CTERM serine protease